MVKITIEYTGQLHCVATHGPSGRALETDAPADNHGRGESFSPTDLVATALGSCMATVMGIYARQKEIDLSGMKIEVTKEMTKTAPRKIARLAAEIWMPPALERNPAFENAALTCPVHHSLHPDVVKPVVFHWGIYTNRAVTSIELKLPVRIPALPRAVVLAKDYGTAALDQARPRLPGAGQSFSRGFTVLRRNQPSAAFFAPKKPRHRFEWRLHSVAIQLWT